MAVELWKLMNSVKDRDQVSSPSQDGGMHHEIS